MFTFMLDRMCMHHTNKYGPTFENIAAAGVVVQTSTGYINVYFKKFTWINIFHACELSLFRGFKCGFILFLMDQLWGFI